MRELCRRFEISPTTGYKWLGRYRRGGRASLADGSRRPLNSPNKVDGSVERAVLKVRLEHPAWGARKIRRRLETEGFSPLPARSTINGVLHRNGLIDTAREQRDLVRFERPQPNDLWQIDFKGYFSTGEGDCHPLTLLDDHSRYSVGIFACAREDDATVRPFLERVFQRHGLPRAVLCDNGTPWGSSSDRCPVTALGVWLWRLGVDVIHGRPYHPQTQGKLERFHRSLKAEVLTRPSWDSHAQCQQSFERWRRIYNEERPHEALEDNPPVSRYRASGRSMPRALPSLEYDEGVIIRRLCPGGALSFRNRFYYVGRAFEGHRLGLVRTCEDGVYEVRFGWKSIGEIDESKAPDNATQTTSIWQRRKL